MTYRYMLLASVCCGMMGAAPAMAQDANAPVAPTAAAPADANAAPAVTGDIVVTAQRRSQNLQNTPIAISAFTPQMLEARGAVQVADIAASTPGLYITQGTAEPSTLQIAMRGALEQNGGSITSESPVAIYIDDVYQSRLSTANYDLADLARVEVLRGPQGTLYGRNSMTGAIKLITRQPDGTSWFNTDVSYSRFQEVRAKVSVGTPLGEHLALAASGYYDDRNEGWQYDLATNQRVGTFKHYGAQGQLGITNVPGLEAVAKFSYVKVNSDGQHFTPISEKTLQPSVPFSDTLTPAPAYGDNHQFSSSLHLGYDLGGVTIRSITAYQSMHDAWALDFAGGYIQPATGAIDTGFYRKSDGGQNQFTQEFQVLGKAFDQKLHYIFGAYYFDEHSHQTTNDTLDAFFLSYLPENFEVQSKSLAFYGQADYAILPDLIASVGIRYTDDHKHFEGTTQDGTIIEEASVADAVSAHVWTPRFNLQYNAMQHVMVYGTISKGYRAAGFNSLVIADPKDFGSPYKPETSWSYEVGAKFDAFDRKLRINLAAYYEQLSNLQTLADAGGGSFIIENAAKSKVEGLESEVTVNPVKGLNLFGNLTYTYDQYEQLAATSEAAEDGATRLPLVSRWQWQLGGSYEVALPNNHGALNLSGDYNYRSHYYSLVSLAPSSNNPSIGRANATLTYKAPQDRWELYTQATNLFNAKNYFTSSEFITGVFGYKIAMEPRVWRVGFRYKM